MAPGAVTHKRHEFFFAALYVAAASDISFVAVFARGANLKPRPVAPWAISPVRLETSIATWTTQWESGLTFELRLVLTAPGTAGHSFRNRATTATAVAPRFQQLAIAALELSPLHALPMSTISANFS